MHSQRIVVVTVPTLDTSLAQLRADPRLDVREMIEPPASPEGQAVEWPLDQVGQAEVLFCHGYAPRNIAAMRKLRWVQIASAGFETFIPMQLPSHGIRLTNALGVFD